jgi:hypothetical protein
VSQVRGTTTLTLTQINATNFPYDANFTIKEKIDSFDNTVYVDGDEIPVYIATPRSASSLNLVDVIWIKEISSVEWHVYYYDKIMFKYNPTDGDLILAASLFDDAEADITAAFIAADVVVTAAFVAADVVLAALIAANDVSVRSDFYDADVALVSSLELGTASRLDVGTDALDVVQLNGDGRLPPVDGSLLTDLPVATAPAGSIIQRTFDESTAVTSYSSLIPRAGSAPANTVGTEILSRTITPSAGTNKLLIRFQGNAHPSAVGVAPTALVFVDGVFKRGAYARSTTNVTTYPLQLGIEFEITAPDTTPIVVTVRVGPSITNGDVQFNDNSWGSTGKGATLVIEEVKV